MSRQNRRRRDGDEHIDRESDELGCDHSESVEVPLSVARLDDKVLALGPAVLTQPFPKLGETIRVGRAGRNESDTLGLGSRHAFLSERGFGEVLR